MIARRTVLSSALMALPALAVGQEAAQAGVADALSSDMGLYDGVGNVVEPAGLPVYTTQTAVALMSPGAMLVLVYDADDALSQHQLEMVQAAFAQVPDMVIPVLGLHASLAKDLPEFAEWDLGPGVLLGLRDGYVEARRADPITADQMVFLLAAVLMFEEGEGDGE